MPKYLPPLASARESKNTTGVFAGLNKTQTIREGEFSDMKNLTSDEYPLLAVRPPRGIPEGVEAKNPKCISVATSINAYEKEFRPVYIDGEDIVIGTMRHTGYTLTEGEKQIVHMGAYVIILPDMLYFNSKSLLDRGKIADSTEARIDPSQWTVSIKAYMRVVDYSGRAADYVQSDEPKGTAENKLLNAQLWHKTRSAVEAAAEDGSNAYERVGLYRYNADLEGWEEEKSYLRLTVIGEKTGSTGLVSQSLLNLAHEVKEGAFLRFSNLYVKKADSPASWGGIEDGLHRVAKVYKDSFKDMDGGIDLVVEGEISTVASGDGTADLVIEYKGSGGTAAKMFKVERYIPKLDYACESGNRLWGCHYGDNGEGQLVNEIYCSALGDFFNWGLGESGDDAAPVTFSLGTDGAFTACTNYGGYPTFFKERYMHRVSGYIASDFSVNTDVVQGVARGASKSLAVIDNRLYYKSPGAVMAYDGSLPTSVSDKLGNLFGCIRAVGGAHGHKYYLCLTKDGLPTVYVLDTELWQWHKEDAIAIESMATDGETTYFIEEWTGKPNRIRTVTASRGTTADTERIQWYAETGLIGMEDPNKKYITRLLVKLKPDVLSYVRVSIQYDSVGAWQQVFATEATGHMPISVPVLPRPCDHFRLRLEGVGGCLVYSITKTLRDGGTRK